MGKDTAQMLKVTRKYNLNLKVLRLTPQLHTQLPAWYHIATPPPPKTYDRYNGKMPIKHTPKRYSGTPVKNLDESTKPEREPTGTTPPLNILLLP